MTSTVTNPVKAFALIALGLAIAAMGTYVANADDAPGAAVIGFLLMFAAVVFGVRTARNRLPIWAGRGGRRLMYMRDLACCAGGMAFYSTPANLVRFALATKADSVNGELAGGSVMSLMTRRDNGIVVAVASNVAHANTAALALKVADVFAEPK